MADLPGIDNDSQWGPVMLSAEVAYPWDRRLLARDILLKLLTTDQFIPEWLRTWDCNKGPPEDDDFRDAGGAHIHYSKVDLMTAATVAVAQADALLAELAKKEGVHEQQ